MKDLLIALSNQVQPLAVSAVTEQLGCSIADLKSFHSDELKLVVQGSLIWLYPKGAMDEKLLSWLAGEPVRFYEQLPSTNSTAAHLAVKEQFTGVVIANEQTAGRGRLRRSWHAEPGQNLLMSVIFRPRLRIEHAARTTLLWAAALAEELRLWVKWPNDLLDKEGNKVAGLLAEMAMDDGYVKHIILGIGLNVNQDTFPEELPNPASLKGVYGYECDRASLLGKMVRRLRSVDLHDSMELWRQRSAVLGKKVMVQGKVGVAEAIREDGALIVDGRAILAADVALYNEI